VGWLGGAAELGPKFSNISVRLAVYNKSLTVIIEFLGVNTS
jgi:hypothetical protein